MRLIQGLSLCILLVVAVTLSGCETAKGFASGLKEGVCRTANGMKKDLIGAGGAVMTADEWIKENLW